jgi:uncharacterized membrane protein YdbT with pleckstrin-like domain
MNKVYRSKVDTWLGILLGGLPIVILFVAWKLIHTPVPGRFIIAIALLVLGVGLPISLLLATTYIITNASLLIQSGVFKREIQIKDISKLELTNDPISSPALSMDRIRIEYGSEKSVLVSPVNKEGFLQNLYDLGVPHA